MSKSPIVKTSVPNVIDGTADYETLVWNDTDGEWQPNGILEVTDQTVDVNGTLRINGTLDNSFSILGLATLTVNAPLFNPAGASATFGGDIISEGNIDTTTGTFRVGGLLDNSLSFLGLAAVTVNTPNLQVTSDGTATNGISIVQTSIIVDALEFNTAHNTQSYVFNTGAASFVTLSGGQASVSATVPTAAAHLSRKDYVDNSIAAIPDPAWGDITGKPTTFVYSDDTSTITGAKTFSSSIIASGGIATGGGNISLGSTGIASQAAAPTSGNHLCNKTYVDSVSGTPSNMVTTNTTQTITGLKNFTNWVDFKHQVNNGVGAARFWGTNVVVYNRAFQLLTSGGVSGGWAGCSNAGVPSWVSTSDYRLKENVESYDDEQAIVGLMAVPVRTYRWIDSQEEDIGWIAHEVQEHFPDVALGEKDATNSEGEVEAQVLMREQFVPHIWAQNRAQQKHINRLEERLAALESKLT